MKVSNFCPNFIIIGAQKAGTTWLYSVLLRSPQVYFPKYLKEVNYFNKRYVNGNEWYKNIYRGSIGSRKICGDASPEYFTDISYISRISKDCPNSKIILLLRNPVSRAVAHYKHLVRTENIPRDFRLAIANYPSIIEWSKYSNCLEFLLKIHEVDKVKIVIFEEMVTDPKNSLSEICQFLGVQFFPEMLDSSIERYGFFVPRFPRTYSVLRKSAEVLRNLGFGFVAHYAKRYVVNAIGQKNSVAVDVSLDDKNELMSIFSSDISYVEDVLHRSIAAWQVP